MVQEVSRESFGHCLIERFQYDICTQKGLQLLGRGSWEEATPDERDAIAAWAEAWVYQARVIKYNLMRLSGEVKSPSHANLLRYQLAAMNAAEARFRALVPEVPEVRGLDPAA